MPQAEKNAHFLLMAYLDTFQLFLHALAILLENFSSLI